MLARLRAIVAKKLHREGALVAAQSRFDHSSDRTAHECRCRDGRARTGESFVAALGAEGFLLMAAMVALFCGPFAVFALLRGGWIAQGAVREAVREETRVRSLQADQNRHMDCLDFPKSEPEAGTWLQWIPAVSRSPLLR